MSTIKSLKCMKCSMEYSPEPNLLVCKKCGSEGILDVLYDYSKINFKIDDLKKNSEATLWRYRSLLPLNSYTPISPLSVGMTPLYHLKNAEKEFGLRKVYIKDEGRNPTASLKDRASAVGISKALEAGAKAVCCASTGNAASSLAGFAASLGVPAYIFVPKRAPKAKIAQLLLYGAKTVIVDDTYDRAFELSIETSEKYGYYNRNCGYNPYLVEGKKTVGYEIWEQLGYKVPDKIFVSLGDGCITSAIYKGFYDLMQLGISDRLPQIIAVQAAGCNPMEIAFKSGEFKAQNPDTIADSIAVGIPRNRLKALRALNESKGDCISVTDDEIKQAILNLPKQSGVFAEPAAATAFAGYTKYSKSKKISPDESVVVLITGNGLKDIDSALSLFDLPKPVEPNFTAVEKFLNT
ncbi:MAG: threonine synthase [Candidatus Riflebacteria bacterium]|nr:threonine synthase [Candidatus Riflebacteria bacterium]